LLLLFIVSCGRFLLLPLPPLPSTTIAEAFCCCCCFSRAIAVGPSSAETAESAEEKWVEAEEEHRLVKSSLADCWPQPLLRDDCGLSSMPRPAAPEPKRPPPPPKWLLGPAMESGVVGFVVEET
jgi:hypothetical protein